MSDCGSLSSSDMVHFQPALAYWIGLKGGDNLEVVLDGGLGVLEVELPLHVHVVGPQEPVECFLLLLDPGPPAVLHLVRRHTDTHLDSEPSKPSKTYVRHICRRNFVATFRENTRVLFVKIWNILRQKFYQLREAAKKNFS